MSVDKCPNIFSRQMKAIVYISHELPVFSHKSLFCIARKFKEQVGRSHAVPREIIA